MRHDDLLDLLAQRPTADGGLLLDLSSCDFLTPAILVAVAAAAHAAGGGLSVRGPAGPDANSYGARMRLGPLLTGLGIEHGMPTVAARDRREDLLEVSAISSPADVRALSALVHATFVASNPRLAQALHGSLAEVGANVPDHAEAVGFMAAQRMPSLGELRLAVADAGVGLHATLARRGAADDSAAVRMALDGVSQYDGPERGTGLPTALMLVTRQGGSVYVASGSSSLLVDAAGRVPATTGAHWQGTIVEIRIPLRRATDASDGPPQRRRPPRPTD